LVCGTVGKIPALLALVVPEDLIHKKAARSEAIVDGVNFGDGTL
jgi:hypothetical protein